MTISRADLDAGRVDLSNVIDLSVPQLPPVSPGELLRDEWLVPLNMTPYRLARCISVPPNRVTAILSGDRAITADTALRLGRFFGTDAQSWLNLQAQFDLAVEMKAHGSEIMEAVQPMAAAG